MLKKFEPIKIPIRFKDRRKYYGYHRALDIPLVNVTSLRKQLRCIFNKLMYRSL